MFWKQTQHMFMFSENINKIQHDQPVYPGNERLT